MQFKVPQFLEIEDKIFGPFTFREFAYLAGGAGLCFVFYKILGLVFGAIPILIMAGFVIALTFYRPNDKPLIHNEGRVYFASIPANGGGSLITNQYNPRYLMASANCIKSTGLRI